MIEVDPKYSQEDLERDIRDYVEDNYKRYKKQHYNDTSLTLGSYFDRAIARFVHWVSGEPIMSKNIKKKKMMQVLKAIGKQRLEEKNAPYRPGTNYKVMPWVDPKKAPADRVKSMKLHNKIAHMLSTMPEVKVKPKPRLQVKKNDNSVSKSLLRNSEMILAKLTKAQKKGKINNVSATRNGRGKIVGINYDYSSNKNRNFIRVSLDNDMMVVNTRQLVTQIETKSTIVGTQLYQVMINPTQSLGGEREKRFASCFDKYDITKCLFEYNPASATTVSGNMFGGFSFDPTEYYPPSVDGLEKLLTKVGSHDCMFYGGGKAGQYVWEMPRYPGKKPTFFIDQTDASGSGIRFANEAQFLLLNGFGIKDAELGIMGSFWCEMTTKFYDPYIQNIEGTKSVFYSSAGNIVASSNDQKIPSSYFTQPDVSNTGGVEYVLSIPTLNKPGYYLPPGVWSMQMMCNNYWSASATSLTVDKRVSMTPLWWNVTVSDWKIMDGVNNNLPVGNPAYSTSPLVSYSLNDDGASFWGPRECIASGKIVIPNDGLDYYIGFQNTSGYVDSGSGNYINISMGFNNDPDHGAQSFLQFNWHVPNAYDASFISPSTNVVVVDRIKALEMKMAAIEDGRLEVSPTSESKDAKESPALKEVFDSVDRKLMLKEKRRELYVTGKIKQGRHIKKSLNYWTETKTVVQPDGGEEFSYDNGDGVTICKPPKGAFIFIDDNNEEDGGAVIWERSFKSPRWQFHMYLNEVCYEDGDGFDEIVEYEARGMFNQDKYVPRNKRQIMNNEPPLIRSALPKSTSLK